MKKELGIYNYQRKLDSAIEQVKCADISGRNKELIFDFRNFCGLNGIGVPRTLRYLGVLNYFASLLKVDFDKATKEDSVRVVSVVQNNEKYAAWTKATYRIMLKRFYRWLKNTGKEHPEEVKWINTALKRNEKKLPSNGDLLTEEEVKKLIDLAEHPRDKAFVSVLYESGARIGEVGSLQIFNVRFDEYGAVINVEGKTGCRPIRIISSTPYLVTWLQSHPLKDDNKAALWVNVGTTKHNIPLQYDGMRMILMRLFEKAGIKKRFNPHMFRHSRATFLADHLTEFQMNQYFGWIQGSDMPATYVHMSGQNIDASMLELNGIKVPKNSKESSLKPIICPRCDTINPHDSKFCNKCAGILDLKTAYELETKVDAEKKIRTNYDNAMNTLMNNPEFIQIVMNKIKETETKTN